MNKRFRVLLVTFLFAVLGVALWLVLRPHEPTYKGKPVTVWLRSLTTNGAAGEDSKEALVETGLPAVPYLVTAFEKMLGEERRNNIVRQRRLRSQSKN